MRGLWSGRPTAWHASLFRNWQKDQIHEYSRFSPRQFLIFPHFANFLPQFPFQVRSAARAMRAFVLLSALVAATVADPQHPAGGPAAPNNGCALIVSGPPKSSLFDQVIYHQFGLEINSCFPAIESVALSVLILMDQSRCKQLCN